MNNLKQKRHQRVKIHNWYINIHLTRLVVRFSINEMAV